MLIHGKIIHEYGKCFRYYWEKNMPKLTAGKNVSETYQFGWDPVSYEQHLKTPEGKAELTEIQKRVAEQIYLEQEEVQKFLHWFELQMAPEEELDEKTSNLTQESINAFWKEEQKTIRSDEKSDLNEHSKILDELIKEQEESLRRAEVVDRHIQSHVASLDNNTQQHSSANEQDLEAVYSQKRGDTYSITSYEYYLASRRFTLGEVSQAEKLAALQQREGVAWLCEHEAEKIRRTIEPIKERLLTLPQNSPERRELENQIAQAENLATIKEEKALAIRKELAIERGNVSQTLETIRRDEARWDIAAAQSGVDVNLEDHAAQIARRNQMLQGIQNLSALRSPEERQAARREVLRTSGAPAPSTVTPSRPGTPSPIQRVREAQQQRINDPYGARNFNSMTREQALDVLGISPEQWRSLPPDTLESQRKDTGEIQDKGDLLVESQISKSQLYTDYKIPGNREKQGEIQRAYQVLDKEISEESEALSATKAESSPVVAPQQVAEPAVSPEPSSAVAVQPVVESSIPTPMSVDAPAQAQLRPPSAPPWQSRRMDTREREAIADTIDKNSQVQSRFYGGNLEQQRAIVDEQYQQAIKEQERAAAELAKAEANPTKSSALANQQDREYLASIKQEADNNVKQYETLANYYGVKPEPKYQSQFSLQSTEMQYVEAPKPQYIPEPEKRLSQEEMRQARLKRIDEQSAPAPAPASPPAPSLPIDPGRTSLSVKSSDALNVDSPEQREQRFSNIVEGEESVIIPHSEEDGYYVQIGKDNVLDVTEKPMEGLLSADLSYDKNGLSPDAVGSLMTAACVSAGVGANSVVQVSGDASEAVQQSLIDEELFASEKNITTEYDPESSEENSFSTSPFQQEPAYSSGGSGDDDDDYDESSYPTPKPPASSSSSSGA